MSGEAGMPLADVVTVLAGSATLIGCWAGMYYYHAGQRRRLYDKLEAQKTALQEADSQLQAQISGLAVAQAAQVEAARAMAENVDRLREEVVRLADNVGQQTAAMEQYISLLRPLPAMSLTQDMGGPR